ncbi:MAG: hypothetical protein JWO44_990 [Bacteroidetes bacterium]|nr:hypothetical protein [Bacteroidota bacterium]
MKYIFNLLFILLFSFSCKTNKNLQKEKSTNCSNSIYIDEYGRYFKLSVSTDTIIVNPTDKQYAKIVLFDCKGAMFFEGYKDSLLYVKGSYLSAKEVTINNVTQENVLNPGEMKQGKEEVYDPLRNGEWKYYEKGELSVVKTYIDGNLVKTSKE